MTDFMELDEVAELLGLDRSEVYLLVRTGGLAGIRTGAGRWLVESAEAMRFKSGEAD